MSVVSFTIIFSLLRLSFNLVYFFHLLSKSKWTNLILIKSYLFIFVLFLLIKEDLAVLYVKECTAHIFL